MQNPKNFKKETFIDQYKKKVFIEEEDRFKPAQDDNSDEETEVVLAFPKFVNQTKPIPKQVKSISSKDRLQMRAKPRSAFNTEELIRPKSPWSLPKSFFGKFKSDNDMIIGKCFDYDWRCSTLEKMIKDP